MLSIYRVRTDPYIAQDRSVHRRDQRLLIPPFRRIFYRDDDKKEKADRRVHRTAFICTGFFRTKSREIKNRNVFAARNDRTLYAAREKDHLLIPYFGRIRRRRFFHRRGVLSPPEKLFHLYDNFGSCISIEDIQKNSFNSYHSFFAYCPQTSDVYDEILPAGTYLRAFCIGDWGKLPEIYRSILYYARKHNLTLTGYAYEEGLNEMSIKDRSDYITMITIKCD